MMKAPYHCALVVALAFAVLAQGQSLKKVSDSKTAKEKLVGHGIWYTSMCRDQTESRCRSRNRLEC